MTSPFTDDELARLAKNPQHDISDLARELLEARRDARRYEFWRDRGFCNQPLEDMLACAETADDFDALLDGWIDNAMQEGK